MSLITCFQHIDCEGPGTLGDILGEKGIGLEILKPSQGDPIPESLGDGLVVLGGPMGVYEEGKFPWMTKELEAIRGALQQGLPILGICLGSQLLARAAGAQVFRGAVPEVGWYPVHLTDLGRLDPLFLGLPPVFSAFHWHGDTFTLPEGARRLASSAYYPNQIFKVGTNAYGFQCHLEVTDEMVASWSSLYAKELTPSGGPVKPERIQEGLARNLAGLEGTARKVFGRFAALI